MLHLLGSLSILPWPDRRGKFSRLAIPITPVLLPALVRSGVERPACFLLKTSEPSLPPKRTECPGHAHSSLLVSFLLSRIPLLPRQESFASLAHTNPTRQRGL